MKTFNFFILFLFLSYIQTKNHGCAASGDNINELKTAYYQKIVMLIKNTF